MDFKLGCAKDFEHGLLGSLATIEPVCVLDFELGCIMDFKRGVLGIQATIELGCIMGLALHCVMDFVHGNATVRSIASSGALLRHTSSWTRRGAAPGAPSSAEWPPANHRSPALSTRARLASSRVAPRGITTSGTAWRDGEVIEGVIRSTKELKEAQLKGNSEADLSTIARVGLADLEREVKAYSTALDTLPSGGELLAHALL